MTSVFDLQGNVVEKPEKDGYINHVFRLPSNGYNYGSSINLNLTLYVTKKAVLPQENLGWKIGDVITYQIPDNIYFNSDNSGGDVYFFVNENGANVSATPEDYIEELKKHNIPNIESKLKEYIINFNKNINIVNTNTMKGGFPFGKKKEAATTIEFFLSELNSTDTLKTLTSSNFKKEDIKKLISTLSDDEITNAEKATAAAVEASPVEEEVAEAAAEAPAEEITAAAEAARLEMKLNEAKKTEEYATAALDGDYDSASEGDGVDMDVLERDEEAQKEAERKKKVAEEALKKFRVDNAAILATIRMRPKNAGQEGDGQDI